jgi:hypothetical protein
MQGRLIYEDQGARISVSIMARANAHGSDANEMASCLLAIAVQTTDPPVD